VDKRGDIRLKGDSNVIQSNFKVGEGGSSTLYPKGNQLRKN